MASVTPELKSFKRIVVKVGSSLLVNAERGELYSDWLNALAEDLSERAKAGAQIDGEQIVAQLKSQLANFKIPKRCFVVEQLPRNTMGKVQKNLLRDQHRDLFA